MAPILLIVITGMIYPLAMTTMAQVVFPWQANGSLLNRNGQPFDDPMSGGTIFS